MPPGRVFGGVSLHRVLGDLWPGLAFGPLFQSLPSYAVFAYAFFACSLLAMGAAHNPRYQAFLERLRRARSESGLHQKEVAEMIGREQPFISRCESGERRVDVIELQDFAKAYGKPVEWFLPPIPRK